MVWTAVFFALSKAAVIPLALTVSGSAPTGNVGFTADGLECRHAEPAALPLPLPRPANGWIWVRARHKIQVPELQRHYSEWQITGAPEIRHVTETSTQQFNPFGQVR